MKLDVARQAFIRLRDMRFVDLLATLSDRQAAAARSATDPQTRANMEQDAVRRLSQKCSLRVHKLNVSSAVVARGQQQASCHCESAHLHREAAHTSLFCVCCMAIHFYFLCV
jgi:hypothetical protein